MLSRGISYTMKESLVGTEMDKDKEIPWSSKAYLLAADLGDQE